MSDEITPDKKSRKNNSAGKPYYTQRNNKIKPEESCNVTSMINALSTAGWPVEEMTPEGIQPEDHLLRFIMTDPICLAKWKKLDPAGKIPPNEWHEVLALGANRMIQNAGYKSSPVTFYGNLDEQTIVSAIDDGGAAVVSGSFLLKNSKKLDHVVSIVGYTLEKKESGNDFVLDDPWGDYHTGYANHKGDDIVMPWDDFVKIIKPVLSQVKYGHIIKGCNG
jgi:hypothetical protein